MAAATPPPIRPMNANCDAPVNISSESAHACGTDRPAADASAPNESPYAPVAAPIPSASRTIGRMLRRLERSARHFLAICGA